MKDVTVNRDELLVILKNNRSKHRAIFDEAVEGYQQKALETLNQNIEALRQNKHYRISFHLTPPEDHTKDYDRAIRMVEMSLNAQVVLDEEDFMQYVQDDWVWKRQFLVANSAYSGTAAFLAQSN